MCKYVSENRIKQVIEKMRLEWELAIEPGESLSSLDGVDLYLVFEDMESQLLGETSPVWDDIQGLPVIQTSSN